MRLGSVIVAATLVLGCQPTQEARDASYVSWSQLQELAVAEPVLCSGRSLDGYLALDALKVQVEITAGRWHAGRPSCSELMTQAALDPEDLSAPEFGSSALAGLQLGGADAVLVTMATVDESCDAGPACEADALTLGAFLYDASGRLVWKSITSRSLGFGHPSPSLADPRQLLYGRPRHPEERVVASR
ncbi:MAG: hypothetical protein JNL21_12405 [Myxococcales bacterium]|nr:hypothetical protein [Myxococcales bacterium]